MSDRDEYHSHLHLSLGQPSSYGAISEGSFKFQRGYINSNQEVGGGREVRQPGAGGGYSSYADAIAGAEHRAQSFRADLVSGKPFAGLLMEYAVSRGPDGGRDGARSSAIMSYLDEHVSSVGGATVNNPHARNLLTRSLDIIRAFRDIDTKDGVRLGSGQVQAIYDLASRIGNQSAMNEVAEFARYRDFDIKARSTLSSVSPAGSRPGVPLLGASSRHHRRGGHHPAPGS